jgi:hypothetical protein
VIKTDHINLKHLLEQRLHHTLQHKGLCKLLGLDYVIQYKKRVDNVTADALSRREHTPVKGESNAVTVVNPQWLEELTESYQTDPWAQNLLMKHQQGDKLPDHFNIHCGIIRKRNKIYVGIHQGWRSKMIRCLHDSHLGHSGVLGTYHRLKRIFF